uniref:Uncharacterized protein n=1 Tax=Vespula pensylvanica TaxID=30213 RepID=A0A834PDI5_VESPE|nr:hypothetical protein H0235_000120 [Vespula pensylvanica]
MPTIVGTQLTWSSSEAKGRTTSRREKEEVMENVEDEDEDEEDEDEVKGETNEREWTNSLLNPKRIEQRKRPCWKTTGLWQLLNVI